MAFLDFIRIVDIQPVHTLRLCPSPSSLLGHGIAETNIEPGAICLFVQWRGFLVCFGWDFRPYMKSAARQLVNCWLTDREPIGIDDKWFSIIVDEKCVDSWILRIFPTYAAIVDYNYGSDRTFNQQNCIIVIGHSCSNIIKHSMITSSFLITSIEYFLWNVKSNFQIRRSVYWFE